MEKLTKRILAIVLIAVIGVGVGVTVWIFVAPYGWSATDCPGAPASITEDQIIKIGIAGDTKRIHGEGQVHGAWLAAYQINTGTGAIGSQYPGGGILIGGKRYYIGITSEDTDEANPILDTTKGKAAADRLAYYRNVQFAAGGFRTESLLAYRDVFMDNKIPFINIGSATDSFTEDVLNNYEQYKYFFQLTPIKGTDLAKELIALILTSSIVATVLPAALGGYFVGETAVPVVRFSFVRESLEWTEGFAQAITAFLTNSSGANPYMVMSYTGVDIEIPQGIGPTEMDAHWATLDAANTQIVIPIISGEAGLVFSNSYGDNEPGMIPLGINVMSQDSAYWGQTAGRCEYGITLESVIRTNKTSYTIDIWDDYVAKWGDTPIYTAVGGFDAVSQYAWAFNTSQSLNPDTIVTTLESMTKTNSVEGFSAFGAYDNADTPPNDKTRHCIVEGWPYGTSLAIQWHNEAKALVPGIGIYPSGIWATLLGKAAPYTYELAGMQNIKYPSWGLNSHTEP
ncbi:MAG: ABC transporter substrate-binding protein [Candidatus Lokiarchaeota archaeon]|nr:ABC transporter substrate-binding protein [Candidatus Lokiarchaeota archaeon]